MPRIKKRHKSPNKLIKKGHFWKVPLPHLSALPDAEEYLEVHIDEADEGEDTCSEGGVPDEREGVPAPVNCQPHLSPPSISYQNMKFGSLLVLLGSTSLVPLFLVKVTSMNLGVFRANESTVTGTM